MKTLVFFLEEPSAKAMLEGLLPRVLSDTIQIRYLVFQGKQDLEKNLKRKLQGWRIPNSFFIVMRDQDAGDCIQIKSTLMHICREAGREEVLVRIACRELESFYLGDLIAVEQGLDLKGLGQLQQRKKFREPDVLRNPSTELRVITGHAYEKIAGSRAIAPFLNLESNRSTSFKRLLSGIRTLMGTS